LDHADRATLTAVSGRVFNCCRKESRLRRWIKDPFPGLSHWLGVALSVAGLVALLVLARGRPWHVVGYAIYGSSLIFLYLASAIAHSIHCSPRAEVHLDRLDYAAIFLLIAGTYTPLCLLPLRGPWGWGLLAGVWGMAAFGITSLFFWRSRKNWPSVLLYIAMGWLAVVALGPIASTFSTSAIAWLAAGGIIYSLGAVVYVTDRPHLWPGRFAAHDLWHVMVLAGSACHFIVMLHFVSD
jgi:hemolysin III